MKNIQVLSLVFFLLLFYSLQAQEEVYTFAEEMPQFSGGNEAFTQYLQTNLQYPEQARKMGIKGKVIVQFMVGKKGEITDVKIMRGIGAGCDEEAIRVLKNSPKWVPGKQRGKPVKVKMVIPINFKFPDTKDKELERIKREELEIKRLQKEAEAMHQQRKEVHKQRLIFTKYVLLDGKEVKTEELQAKMNPAEELVYMYSIKKTDKASKIYGKELQENEGITLVYTKSFRGLRQVLAKYGVTLETRKKLKRLKVNLTYRTDEKLQIALASSKLKQDEAFEPMQFLRDDFTKIGENKYVFEIDLEDDAKDYFLWILEPMSNTNPEPGAFHFIRLDKI